MSASDGSPDVLVVGGGIGGMALAGFLHAEGAEPLVVERAANWERAGWGIGLWRSGLAVLGELGVAGVARARGTAPDRFVVGGLDGRRLATVRVPGNAFLALHRADLHAALRAAVPSDLVRMDTVPTAIEGGDGRVAVTFDDGHCDRFDLVVGADGVGSTVRALWFEDAAAVDRDAVVWSFWAPPGGVPLPEATAVLGRGTEAFVVDVGDREVVNVGTAMSRAVSPDPPARRELRATLASLGWGLSPLLDDVADARVFFDRVRTVRAERWHRGRVALLGDAAHAVHPISGMGAALALEDAYVLADELAAGSDVSSALANYERRRRPRVERVRQFARVQAALTFTDVVPLARVRNALIRWTPFLDRAMERYVRRTAGASVDGL